MTISKTIHTIELTNDEIELITTALHGQYKTERELYEKTEEMYGRYYDAMNQARDLRNAFCKIIGRSYMGEDA